MAIKPEIEELFEREVVKVTDLAKIAGVSRPTIYKWRQGLDISAVKQDKLLSAISALVGKSSTTAAHGADIDSSVDKQISQRDFGLLPEDLVARLCTTIGNALAQARALNDLSRDNPSSLSRDYGSLRRAMRDARRLIDHVDEVCETMGVGTDRGPSRW
ncbi:MAG: hypothetical protein AAGH70_06970 [Pseudomonadota bacterium]